MDLMQRLYEESLPLAAATTVTSLTVGLGYTAVATGDGGLGLSYTWVEDKERRSYGNGYRDVEGEGARPDVRRRTGDREASGTV